MFKTQSGDFHTKRKRQNCMKKNNTSDAHFEKKNNYMLIFPPFLDQVREEKKNISPVILSINKAKG